MPDDNDDLQGSSSFMKSKRGLLRTQITKTVKLISDNIQVFTPAQFVEYSLKLKELQGKVDALNTKIWENIWVGPENDLELAQDVEDSEKYDDKLRMALSWLTPSQNVPQGGNGI